MEKCSEISLRSIRKIKNLKGGLKEINPRPVGVDGMSRVGYKDPIGALRLDPNLLHLSSNLNPLQSLQEDLAFGCNPDAAESFNLDGRNLERGTVSNRIVEKAIVRRLTPLLDRSFCDCSYAFRPGRSAEDAVLAIRSLIRKGYHWAAKIDFERFFESIDRDILERLLSDVLADDALIRAILGATSTVLWVRGQSLQRKKGLPEGNGLSPILSNIYLHGLDGACSDLHYFRYADDVLVLGRNKLDAVGALERVKRLAASMKLKLNRRKTFPRDVHYRPLIFLGYKFCGGNIYPPEKAVEKLKRNLQKFRGQPERGQEVMKAFVRRYRIGTVRKFFRRLDRRLLHLYPPGQSLTSILGVLRGVPLVLLG